MSCRMSCMVGISVAVMGVQQGRVVPRCVSRGRGWPIRDLRCWECEMVLHDVQACMDRADQLHIQTDLTLAILGGIGSVCGRTRSGLYVQTWPSLLWGAPDRWC